MLTRPSEISDAALTHLHVCREEQVQRPHLVVVPLSTFPNWEREFALWAPQLNVVPFMGNQASRDIIKQYEFYADRSQASVKSKSHGRLADQQVCLLLDLASACVAYW